MCQCNTTSSFYNKLYWLDYIESMFGDTCLTIDITVKQVKRIIFWPIVFLPIKYLQFLTVCFYFWYWITTLHYFWINILHWHSQYFPVFLDSKKINIRISCTKNHIWLSCKCKMTYLVEIYQDVHASNFHGKVRHKYILKPKKTNKFELILFYVRIQIMCTHAQHCRMYSKMILPEIIRFCESILTWLRYPVIKLFRFTILPLQ